MNGQGRVKGAIARKPIDRIPFYCDELFVDTELRWLSEGLPASQAKREDLFDYDCTELFVDTSMRFEPKLIAETEETMTVADKYGFVATRNKLTPGIHYHEHPIKNCQDWQRYKKRLHVDFGEQSRLHEVTYFRPFEVWPTQKEAVEIFSRKRASGRHITLRSYGPWEVIWRLLGYEQAMMALYDSRGMLEDMVEHFTTFLIEVVKKQMQYGIKPDSLFLLDDLGSNKGLLISPDIINKLFYPCYKQIGAFTKEQEIDFFFHSCGDIRSIISIFIEARVDVLNPLQATVMDIVDLKEQYGNQITFLGNINSRIMHDREAIQDELDRKITVAMQGGGYIFASDHSIPSEVSLEDYMLILQKAKRLAIY
jgi:uroporphyrinogen decarboxylase